MMRPCIFPVNQLTASISVILGVLLSVAWLGYSTNFSLTHTYQHFLRGLSLSAMNQQGTIPQSINSFIRYELKARRELHIGSHLKSGAADKMCYTNWKTDFFLLSPRSRELKLKPEKRGKLNVPSNVQHYPAVAYLPVIVAGSLGEWLAWSPAIIYYVSTGLYLAIPILIGYFVLLALPSYHWPVLLVLLLPSTISLRSSMYPDGTLLCAVMIFFTLLVRAFYYRAGMTWKAALGFFVSSSLLAITKITYFPLCFVLLFLPRESFSSWKSRLIFMLLVLGGALGMTLIMSSQAVGTKLIKINLFEDLPRAVQTAPWMGGHEALDELVPDWEKTSNDVWYGTSGRKGSFYYFFHYPEKVMDRALNTITSVQKLRDGLWNIFWFSGCKSHWLQVWEWRRTVILGVLFAVIFVLSSLINNQRPATGSSSYAGSVYLGLGARVWVILMCVACATLVMLAMFLLHPTFRSSVIFGMQGRYLLPLLPFLLFLLPGLPVRLSYLRPYVTILLGGLTLLALLVAHTSPFTPYALLNGN